MKWSTWAVLSVSITIATPAVAGQTIHVNGSCGNNTWSGLSDVCVAPDGPKATIQQGILSTIDGDTVLVAAGTYNEAINYGGRTIAVVSTDGPEVTTIDAAGFNTSVVAMISGEGPGTLLEGFTITGGVGFAGFGLGGGVVVFESAPTLNNNVIVGNVSTNNNGGGVYVQSSSGPVVITNCLIVGNSAMGAAQNTNGGGLYSVGSDVAISGSTFSGNSAESGGGGITFSRGGGLTLGNQVSIDSAIVWGNTAVGDGPDIHAGDTTLTIGFTDVTGGIEAIALLGGTIIDNGGNIDDDPLFVDPANDDYHLQSCSPAVNAGDPGYVPDPGETDIDGDDRVINGTVDMGADEVTEACCPFDCDDNGVVDSSDFLAFLANFGDDGGFGCSDGNQDGTVDSADFLAFLAAFGPCP